VTIIRPPAVAGRFYPANPAELTETIREYTRSDALPIHAIGAVIPHAGYMYSGHVAGAVYSRILLPQRMIVLCPNHTGMGPPLSIMKAGSWQTPLGLMEIDEEISEALIQADPSLADDAAAHRFEHATEVQLPFIQFLAGAAARFVPITLGTANRSDLEVLGNAMAQVIRNVDSPMLMIASSDMNHYESDSVTRAKDRKAIDRMLALDARGLYDTVRHERISMCGFGPATSMLVAATQLGASRTELVKYATSGEVSGDFGHVVGYAGIAVV
jgi:AmmeMemoRadiSam system protein B